MTDVSRKELELGFQQIAGAFSRSAIPEDNGI
jgi:hypothetical protein